jgi:hypothetical protein
VSEPTSAVRPGLLSRQLAPRALRWSLVDLCRRTTHEGWEHLQSAAAAGHGVALVAAAGTPWVVAARALAAWAGPLHLAMPAGAADRRLARLACTNGDDGPRLAADPETVAGLLAAGEKVLFVLPGEAPPDLAPLPAGAAPVVLAVTVERPSRGRYRVVLGGAVPVLGRRGPEGHGP